MELIPTPILYPFAIIFLCMNLIAFAAMGLDKHYAKCHLRRIPEKCLFLFALLFGAPGGTLGMYVFRHKTRHLSFSICFPLLALVQIALIFFAATHLLF